MHTVRETEIRWKGEKGHLDTCRTESNISLITTRKNVRIGHVLRSWYVILAAL
jgi:hypothetical protein